MRARNRIVLALVAIWFISSVAGTALAAGKRRSGSHRKTPAAQHANRSRSPAIDMGAASASKPGTAKPVVEVRPQSGDTRGATRETVRQESRIEFDERMLRGQSASGAIYLFQRSPSEFKSIVQVPDTFRPRTVQILSPGQGEK
jgi:hypothetical protein